MPCARFTYSTRPGMIESGAGPGLGAMSSAANMAEARLGAVGMCRLVLASAPGWGEGATPSEGGAGNTQRS